MREQIKQRKRMQPIGRKKSAKSKRQSLFCALVWLLLLLCSRSYAEENIELYARSAVLMDGSSGRILYGKEEDLALPMASTTKIMTCILALEEGELEQICRVSENAAKQPQVKLGMRAGQEFCLKDLLYSLMLESHNDTAVCIAEAISGSTEAFAERMNQKAMEIGCVNTHYVTPNGLDQEDAGGAHHTTAAELAKVMRYCVMQSPKKEAFLEITGADHYAFQDITGKENYSCVNHNAFLQMMDGAVSGKTGFTAKSGYCYVGVLEKEDRVLIAALLACGWPGHKSWKWADTRTLMEYGMEYEVRTIENDWKTTGILPVKYGKTEGVKLCTEEEEIQVLMKKEEPLVKKVYLSSCLSAPLRKGEIVGSIQYFTGDTLLFLSPILCAEDAAEKEWRDYLADVIALFQM